MERSVLNVEGMSCGHCATAVTKALKALQGVQTVEVDLKAKTVTVEHDPARASLEKIKLEIEDQGYDVVSK
ncbi:MAG: copper chaperone CopZ [Candidatus Methanoplasma sp.]|jgi:copper chaperone|nr:copper chaperone CopZ [Candidatus Methanoplasma sp.]